MTTPLYPTFQKHINDAIENLINTQVVPWAFLNSGKPFRVKKFDGREIAYEGIGFEGSPRTVFWGRYIEPFLEDIVVKEIAETVSACREKGVDARQVLPELEGLLISACRRTLAKMAEIDQRLQGQGFPEKIPIRSIENEIASLTEFIQVRINSELEMWKSLKAWYERNKYWLLIVVPVLVALVSLVLQKYLKN